MTTATRTKIATNRYWDSNGLHQEMYQQVKGLIPNKGPAPEETLETLRLVANAYCDVYNNGAWNGFRFADALPALEQSDLTTEDKKTLNTMFTAAADQSIEIEFAGRKAIDEDDVNEDDEDQLDWIRRRVLVKESEFSQPLEHLVDWAVRRAWFKHCA